MKRLLLIATLAIVAALGVSVPAAQAVSCSPHTVGTPQQNQNGDLTTSWSAMCTNAMWNAQVVAQFEASGVWNDATCSSGVCVRFYPSDGSFFSSGSFHSDDTIAFNPVATICTHRWRVHLFIGTPNPPNPHITYTSGIKPISC